MESLSAQWDQQRWQLVFWQNIISPHQAPFMRRLAEMGHAVHAVSTEDMSADRKQLGWAVPSLGSARITLNPQAQEVIEIVGSSASNAVHFIAGARCTALGGQVASACRRFQRHMGLITESPDARGLRGQMRWVKYCRERMTIGRHFEFILAMGQRGLRWFRNCGYPVRRTFPFAYVTDRSPGHIGDRRPEGITFLFVGQLIHRKAVDLLLRAMAATAHLQSAQLSIIGDGPERKSLETLATGLGIAGRVCWHGTMAADQVPTHLARADVLILPSREDGWGAVVNEALLAGTPVICSTACGASDLIQHPWLGTVFKTNNSGSLAQAMVYWGTQGGDSASARQRIQNWAQCIEAPAVTDYLLAILGHLYGGESRPQPPWWR